MAKRKRTLWYALGMLLGALLLVAASMLLKLYMEQAQELDSLREQATSQSVTVSNDAIKAAELLVLAQDAYYRGDSVEFHAYMAMLDGYADELSEKTYEIYEALHNELS